jgi:hypothetical protein
MRTDGSTEDFGYRGSPRGAFKLVEMGDVSWAENYTLNQYDLSSARREANSTFSR